MNIYPSVVIPATAITVGNALIDSTTLNAFAAPIVSGSPFDFGPYRDGRSYLELYSAGVLVGKALISKSKSAGESLDTAIVSDTMASDGTANWVLVRCTLVFDTDHYVYDSTPDNSGPNIHKLTGTSAIAGALYKAQIDLKNGTGSATDLRLYKGFADYFSPLFSSTASYVTTNWYSTAGAAAGFVEVGLGNVVGFTGNLHLKNYNYAKLTSPAATAALLESSPGVRGWIYKSTSSFENAALTMKIIQHLRAV
jgi:hypothetical protein